MLPLQADKILEKDYLNIKLKLITIPRVSLLPKVVIYLVVCIAGTWFVNTETIDHVYNLLQGF